MSSESEQHGVFLFRSELLFSTHALQGLTILCSSRTSIGRYVFGALPNINEADLDNPQDVQFGGVEVRSHSFEGF
jgi:hypothetical protein